MGAHGSSSALLPYHQQREAEKESLMRTGMRRSHGKMVQIALTEGTLLRSDPEFRKV